MPQLHVKVPQGSQGSTSLCPQCSTVNEHHNPTKPTNPTNPTLPTPPTTPSATPTEKTNQSILIDAPMSAHPHHSCYHRHQRCHRGSHASIDTKSSQRSRKEYMDSLVPPSPDEMARIDRIQVEREKEEKRRGREREKETRRSLDLPRSSLDVQSLDKPRRTGIRSSLRHKKSNGAYTQSRKSSVSTPSHVAASASSTVGGPTEHGSGENVVMQRAATVIQKTYRGYKTRRELKGLGLDADTRWTHLIRELKFREMVQPRGKDDVPKTPVATEAAQDGMDADQVEAMRRSSSARYKWRKVATIAARAAADMDDDESDSDSDSDMSDPAKRKIAQQQREEAKARRRKDARVMGLQYFLEMVDLKHRYGSNLRTYHEEWKKADTNEPFFYWLDFGEGRYINMASCPRERLDREQVRYLSREERQYYLVQVDGEGRLCWAKNGMRIDTTEQWKDSIHGIVPVDDPTPAFQPNLTTGPTPQDASSTSPDSSDTGDTSSHSPVLHASGSELEAARAAKYASPDVSDAKGYQRITHLSASTIMDTLLRKSVRKNTWIFVADTAFRLYVGIKDSGAFQHSSFVQGSRISAAGSIKIKQGRLASLSPLSGHYRPPTANFRAFVHNLQDEGVDTSHVAISKSYAVLLGLELYLKTQARGKRLLAKAAHGKDRIVRPEAAARRRAAAADTAQSAATERLFLARQRAGAGAGARASLSSSQRPGEGGAGEVVEEQVVAEEKAEAEERVGAAEKAKADVVRVAAQAAGGSADAGARGQGGDEG